MNKYGGINDSLTYDPKIYNLWFNMLRRCYDTTQHKRSKGKSYADCEVCEDWKYLSCFERDIKTLSNYDKWKTSDDYVLDKDTIKQGNRIYSKDTCCFITKEESLKEMNIRNPQVHGNRKVGYMLIKDDEVLKFEREKDACVYLGVVQSTVSSCYLKGYKCKGYVITKMDGKDDVE